MINLQKLVVGVVLFLTLLVSQLGSAFALPEITPQDVQLQYMNRLSRAELITRLGHWEFDLATNRVVASEGAKEVYGLYGDEWSISEVQNIPLPAYRAQLDQALQGLIVQGSPYDIKFRIKRPSDGEIVYIRSIAEYDPQSNTVFGTLLDITEYSLALASMERQKNIIIFAQILFLVGGLITVFTLVRLLSLRKQAMNELRKREQDLEITLESIGDAVIATDTLSNITRMNSVAQGLTGWTATEAIGRPLAEVFHIVNTFSRNIVEHPVAKVLETGNIVGLANHTTLLARGGQEYQIADSAAPIKDIDGTIQGVILVFRDVSEEYAMQDELTNERILLRTLVDNLPTAVFLKDLATRKLLANRQDLQNMGIENEEDVLGKTDHEIFPKDIATKLYEDDQNVLQSGKPLLKSEEKLVLPSGEERWLETSKIPLFDDHGSVRGLIGIGYDITERKRAQEELEHLTLHDPLTNLPNRRFFEAELKRVDKSSKLPISLMMVDVNGLKIINDSLGHQEGDKMLQQVATVIKKACRRNDVIARFGGDEFVLILPNTSQEQAGLVSAQIASFVKLASEAPVQLSLSWGYATKTSDDQDIMDVLKEAEDYLYRHKSMNSSSSRSALVASLQRTLMEKSNETEEHAKTVQQYAVALGQSLKLTETEVNELSLLGLLHDLGKVAISESILNKTGTLSADEWEIMKTHSEIGYRIAIASPDLVDVAQGILSHHERWDGKGYPRGLKEEAIPKLARIITIVDAFEAMTSDRTYRQKLSVANALDEILSCAGTQFDPALAKAFVNMMSQKQVASSTED